MIDEELKRVDYIWRENTYNVLRELFPLFYNGNYVSSRISERYMRIEGYTRRSSSEIMELIDLINIRYGNYCDIRYTYDPCNMFLKIDIKERKEGECEYFVDELPL